MLKDHYPNTHYKIKQIAQQIIFNPPDFGLNSNIQLFKIYCLPPRMHNTQGGLTEIGSNKFHELFIFFIGAGGYPEISGLAVNVTDLF